MSQVPHPMPGLRYPTVLAAGVVVQILAHCDDPFVCLTALVIVKLHVCCDGSMSDGLFRRQNAILEPLQMQHADFDSALDSASCEGRGRSSISKDGTWDASLTWLHHRP